MHRLFFALWPPEVLRGHIERSTRREVEASGGRAVPARNFHVTLAFLGAVPAARLGVAVQAGVQTRGEPFELTLGLIEPLSGSRVLCLTAQEPPAALGALHRSLADQLQAQQFELEQRAFRPHLTLARDLRRVTPGQMAEPLSWPVREFVLVESVPAHAGSSYSILERWPLAKPAPIQ